MKYEIMQSYHITGSYIVECF